MDALAAKQWEAAAEVNRAVVDQFEGGDTPWARLGLVRDSMQRGEFTTARQGATELLAAHPGYADGHEVLGQLCVELGDIRGALDAYRQASQLTPGCILRLQTCGALAFYADVTQEASAGLECVTALGLRSKLFDGLTLAPQAVLWFDAGDVKSLAAVNQQMHSMAAEFEASRSHCCTHRRTPMPRRRRRARWQRRSATMIFTAKRQSSRRCSGPASAAVINRPAKLRPCSSRWPCAAACRRRRPKSCSPPRRRTN
jgi:hypothetical protein